MTSLPRPQHSGFATLTFTINVSSSLKTSCFGPRIGTLTLGRLDDTINISTPAMMTCTSRGVVPHLSRDHHRFTRAIRWVQIPFESFLDHSPPVPILQSPLHTFLGYSPSKNILSMSVRNPVDGREMPPNGNDHISAHCIRGVRKLTTSDWRSHVLACKPDAVVALSDIPFTKPPYSQKRVTKSIERSVAWLADILRPIDLNGPLSPSLHPGTHPLNILVHMAGGTIPAARTAFAEGLRETLHGKEGEVVKPLECLDDGVTGYVFDLAPLRSSLAAEDSSDDPISTIDQISSKPVEDLPRMYPLFEASLESLSTQKLRIVNSTVSPHEVLRLIQHIGIDLFDSHWAQKAADIGIALDLRFPVPVHVSVDERVRGPRIRQSGKRDVGHNLFDPIYAQDFSRLASSFWDSFTASKESLQSHAGTPTCLCMACSPIILPSSLDDPICTNSEPTKPSSTKYLPPFTRAYLHHLLNTHEMSSHSLLVMHNLEVLDALFSGVRAVLGRPDGPTVFPKEVQRFINAYDEDMVVFEEAQVIWSEVKLARGKGRLAREKNSGSDHTSVVDL